MFYKKLFLNQVNSEDPYTLNFFDEVQIKTVDV